MSDAAAMTPSPAPAAAGLQLPVRVRSYVDAVVRNCAEIARGAVSVVLFGSGARGGLSAASDVDLILVVPDDATAEDTRRLRDVIARLEAACGFRCATPATPGALKARVERAVGYNLSCCVCTRADLLSGDVARTLGLRRWEAPFVDRIVLASIIGSAVTVSGIDLLPHVRVPRVRRVDVFKALFAFVCQLVLSIVVFPVFPAATKYAMGTLKHSLHSCYFWYHNRTASLDEEVAFFNRRFGASRTLMELLALRRSYRPSFGFTIRCLPTIASLHVRAACDRRSSVAA
jgi:predicted nucleotidyltransferase